MIKSTTIARQSDGMILCEITYQQISYETKQQIQKILKQSNETFQVNSSSNIEAGSYNLFIWINEGISYLSTIEKEYPPELCLQYYKEVQLNFHDFLKEKYGTQSVDYRSKIEIIDQVYGLQAFDRKLKKISQEYQDYKSYQNVNRLKEQLKEINNIMKQNIDHLIGRGKSLEEMSQKSSTLKDGTKAAKKEVQSMIQFILMVNKQGQTRLAQFYQNMSVNEKTTLEGELVRKCLSRNEFQCSFLEHRGYKIIYRRYASLYFIVGLDPEEENEIAYLEFIHSLVETLDKYFENVCELDIMFNIEKAHYILEEMVMNGQIVETNKSLILAPLQVLDKN